MENVKVQHISMCEIVVHVKRASEKNKVYENEKTIFI
jgi:hypothetical protein